MEPVLRSKNWRDLLDQLAEVGFEFNIHYYDEPRHWISAYDDSNIYDIEVTRYSDHTYEIHPDNITIVDENEQYIPLGATYNSDYVQDDIWKVQEACKRIVEKTDLEAEGCNFVKEEAEKINPEFKEEHHFSIYDFTEEQKDHRYIVCEIRTADHPAVLKEDAANMINLYEKKGWVRKADVIRRDRHNWEADPALYEKLKGELIEACENIKKNWGEEVRYSDVRLELKDTFSMRYNRHKTLAPKDAYVFNLKISVLLKKHNLPKEDQTYNNCIECPYCEFKGVEIAHEDVAMFPFCTASEFDKQLPDEVNGAIEVPSWCPLKRNFKESKLTEKFENLSVEELNRIEKNQDPELYNIINTKVVDLPENFKFSFDAKDWKEAISSDIKYGEFLQKLANKYQNFKVLISELDNKIIGWMTYSPLQGSVHSIKFGSLTSDPEKRKELLFDCKEQLAKFLKDYLVVYWFACEENTDVFNYYQRLINAYKKKGYEAGLQDINDSKLFYISRLNKQLESFTKKESKLTEDVIYADSDFSDEEMFGEEGEYPKFEKSTFAIKQDNSYYNAGVDSFGFSKNCATGYPTKKDALDAARLFFSLRASTLDLDRNWIKNELASVEIVPYVEKLRDLPVSLKYSFDGASWKKALENDLTYGQFLEDLLSKYTQFTILISERSNRPIGWMAYSEYMDMIDSVKFGALTFNTDDHIELLFDCKKQLDKFLENYNSVSWFACEENEKVYNYYLSLLEDYKKKGYGADVSTIRNSKLFRVYKKRNNSDTTDNFLKESKNNYPTTSSDDILEALDYFQKMCESNITRKAETDEQEATLEVIERLARDNDIKLTFGTKVGKYPHSIILDHKYQGGEIYVCPNGSFEINGKEFGDWGTESFDINDVDENEIEAALESLKDRELEESKSREFNKKRIVEKRTSHLLNQLNEDISSISYKEVLKRREEDLDFKKKTDVKLKDLPENCKYSFEEEIWNNNQNSSLFEVYEEYASQRPDKTPILLSENKKEILGWISLMMTGHSHIIYGVKFGVFDPTNRQKNIEFFQQFRKYFKEHKDEYKVIHWTGNLNYDFIRHYIDIVKDNDGSIELADKDYALFKIGSIDKNNPYALYAENLEDIKTANQLKYVLEKINNEELKESKVSETFKDLLDAFDYIADDLNNSEFKKEVSDIRKKHTPLKESYLDEIKARNEAELAKWDPKDAELWRSIDWKARNYEEYDTGSKILGTAYLYRANEPKLVALDVTYHKMLRANPIYPPYWRLIESPWKHVAGPMYDGRDHRGYHIHDRYESWDLNKMLSD